MKKTIGERIRELRRIKGYTQDNMATDLEITAGAYAKIERGETDPSATRLLKIAEILEVDITRFFKETSTNNNAEDPTNPYGYASKQELDNLAQMIKQLTKELEKLKGQIEPVKKAGMKKGSK